MKGNRRVKTCKTIRIAVLACIAVSALSGCSKFFKKNDPAAMNGGGAYGNAPGLGALNGIESSVLPEPIRGQNVTESADLKRIYYTFDSASLLEPAKAQLDENAAWLKANPGVQIQIEGHCDSRGISDYNYALGQRRADEARMYLISRGVEPNRIHTISYGADRPDDPNENEMAWARNRRAQFMIFN